MSDEVYAWACRWYGEAEVARTWLSSADYYAREWRKAMRRATRA